MRGDLIDSVRRGELDRLEIPEQPLDILAQQIVAASAAEEWTEDALFAMVRRAYPYRNLEREEFRCRHPHVGRRLLHKARPAFGLSSSRCRQSAIARTTRCATGGDNFRRRNSRYCRLRSRARAERPGYRQCNEDFAIESLQGDIFQLGNTSWRVMRVEQGKVRVEDAARAATVDSFLAR